MALYRAFVLSLIGSLGWTVIAGAQAPLQKGQELRYDGEVRLEVPEKGLVATAKVQVTDLVVSVSEERKAQIASLRLFLFQTPSQEQREGALRLLTISAAGEEEPAPVGQVEVELPLFSAARQFPVLLPRYFLPAEQLKEGNAWEAKEPTLLAKETAGDFRYQVEGKERVNDRECWLVSRTLQKPVVLNARQQVLKVTDRFWADTATGLIPQAQRQTVLQLGEGQTLAFVIHLTLREVRQLDERTFQQRLQQLEAIKGWQEKVRASVFGQPTKEKLDDAEKAIAHFLQRHKDSPYAPYAETWRQAFPLIRKQLALMEQQRELVGKDAPDFELPTVDGKRKVKLSDWRGKVVVVNFFAHWCEPCNAEAPRLEQIWQDYKDKGVVVIGVAVWAEGDPVKEAEGFVQKHKLTYTVLVDAQNVVPDRYGLRGVPTNVVIGKDGKIHYLRTGFLEAELRKAVEEALK